MKIKISFLTLIITALFSQTINSQESAFNNREHNGYREVFSRMSKTSAAEESKFNAKNVIGSQYFAEQFVPGQVLFKNEKLNKLFLLRYNAYKDVIEVKAEEDVIDVVLQNARVSCVIGNKLYTYSRFQDEKTKEIVHGYIRVLTKTDEFTLFTTNRKIYFQEKTSVNPLFPSQKAKFASVEKLYLMSNSTKKAVVLKKKKNFLSKIKESSVKKELSKYIRKERINFKNEDDLIKLVQYHNSL